MFRNTLVACECVEVPSSGRFVERSSGRERIDRTGASAGWVSRREVAPHSVRNGEFSRRCGGRSSGRNPLRRGATRWMAGASAWGGAPKPRVSWTSGCSMVEGRRLRGELGLAAGLPSVFGISPVSRSRQPDRTPNVPGARPAPGRQGCVSRDTSSIGPTPMLPGALSISNQYYRKTVVLPGSTAVFVRSNSRPDRRRSGE